MTSRDRCHVPFDDGNLTHWTYQLHAALPRHSPKPRVIHPHINESFSDGCFPQNPSSCPIDSAILWGALIVQIEDGTSATTRALIFAFENNGCSNHQSGTWVFETNYRAKTEIEPPKPEVMRSQKNKEEDEIIYKICDSAKEMVNFIAVNSKISAVPANCRVPVSWL